MLWSNGGSSSLRRQQDRVRQPAGVAALTLWTNLVQKDNAAPKTSYAQAGSYDGAPAFASGAVAMIVEGQWALSEFKNVDFGVAELPAGTSGHSATGIGVGVASVFDHGAAANTAAETFVQWLSSRAGRLPHRAEQRPAQRPRPAQLPGGQARGSGTADLPGVRLPAEHRTGPAVHPRLHSDLVGPRDRDQRRDHRDG